MQPTERGMVPFCKPHERVVRETQDDVMQILAWSLKVAAHGAFPSERHDGGAWAQEDKWREKRAGSELIHAAVLEAKGDWKHMSACFSVPTWSGRLDKPICRRRTATKRSLHTVVWN